MNRTARLCVDALEDRLTPSATLSFHNGNLTIRGDDAPNTIALNGSGPLSVSVNGTVVGSYIVTGRVAILGGDAEDTVSIGAGAPGALTINTGKGNDAITVVGRVAGDVSVDAGQGDDTIAFASAEVDGATTRIDGGSGNDSYSAFGVRFAGRTRLSNLDFAVTGFSSGPAYQNLLVNNTQETGTCIFTLFPGSAVADDFTYLGGIALDALQLDSDVGGVVTLRDTSGDFQVFAAANQPITFGGLSVAASGGNTYFDLGASADHGVSVTGSVGLNLGDGTNTILLVPTLKVAGDFAVRGGDGVNTLTFAGGSIGGDLVASFGDGSNRVTVTGGIIGGRLRYVGGDGSNAVTLSSPASDQISVRLRGGDALVDLSGIPDLTGTATIDFGRAGGSRTFLAPVAVSGALTVRHYP